MAGLPGDQLLHLLPPEQQLDKVDCVVFSLYLLAGRATDCELQLAVYILHRLGICNVQAKWTYIPCVWEKEG